MTNILENLFKVKYSNEFWIRKTFYPQDPVVERFSTLDLAFEIQFSETDFAFEAYLREATTRKRIYTSKSGRW